MSLIMQAAVIVVLLLFSLAFAISETRSINRTLRKLDEISKMTDDLRGGH